MKKIICLGIGFCLICLAACVNDETTGVVGSKMCYFCKGKGYIESKYLFGLYTSKVDCGSCKSLDLKNDVFNYTIEINDPQPTPEPTPEPTPPRAVNEWVKCGSCYGTGKCMQCDGRGENFYNTSNPYEPCLTCGRTGRCVMCAGQGGHYETFYR